MENLPKKGPLSREFRSKNPPIWAAHTRALNMLCTPPGLRCKQSKGISLSRKSVRYFFHKNRIFTDFLLDFHENQRILARGVTISFRSEMKSVNNKNLKNLLEAVKKTFLPPTVRRKRKFQCWEKSLVSSFVTCSFPFPSTKTRMNFQDLGRQKAEAGPGLY